MPKLSFEIVHNVPSPYRLHLFRALAREAARRSVDFRVHFMSDARGEHTHWAAKGKDLGFPHTFWRDWALDRHSEFSQTNPGLVWHLLRRRPDALMVGGPLSTPTGVLLTVLGPATRRVSVAWVELYRLGPAPGTPWKRTLARRLMRRYARYAVPGEEAVLTVEREGYGRRQQCLLLPNLVDESRFGAAAKPSPEYEERVRAHLGLRPGRRVALWPARLIEVKGIVPFVERLSPAIIGDWDLVIIGDGPLRGAVDDAIGRCGLAGAVRVVPVVKYEEMPQVYRLADLLVLPSLFDQNPLSVVEAMWTGLPLLLSTRVGNFPEALEEGRNGWGFDPTMASETEEVVRRALGTPPERLREMGAASRTIATERWATESAVSRFMEGLFSEASCPEPVRA